MTPKTARQRQRKRRDGGRIVHVVITEPAQIAALDRLKNDNVSIANCVRGWLQGLADREAGALHDPDAVDAVD